MRAARPSVVLFSLVFGTAVRAGGEPPPTPAAKPESAPQHVTAPSLPGEANKQGTVKPDTGMPTDSEGYAITKRYEPGAKPAQATPQPAAPGPGGAGAAPAGAPAAVPNIPIGPAPTGKGVKTGANYVSIRGELVALEPGKSVTIKIQKTGVENKYTLAEGATVAKGVAPGQLVRIRVLAGEKGKVADRVEIFQKVQPTPAKKDGNS